MPAVTVIVPVYGVEKYIEKCTTSILKQTLTDFEVIFVNDCSKDASEQVLLNVLQGNKRHDISIQHIHHKKNMGISATRQTGTSAATADYIFYLDSDDCLAENALEELLFAVQNTHADIAYSDYFEERIDGLHYIDQAVNGSQGNVVAQAMLNHQVSWTPWGKLMRKTLFEGIDWPEGINVGEDLVVITKVFSRAKTVIHVKNALYYYNRANVGSIVSTMNASACRQTKMAIDHLQVYFSNQQATLEALQSTKLFLRFLYLYSQDINLISAVPTTYPETNNSIHTYLKAPRAGRWMMRILILSATYLPQAFIRLEAAFWIRFRNLKSIVS